MTALALRVDSNRLAMIAAWRLVTAGLVEPGECQCALCGDSPHPSARTLREFLPAHFPHPELIDNTASEVCAGCVKIFGGRPSKTNPPVRTRHIAVTKGGTHMHDRVSQLYPYLEDPGSVKLLSWSTSLKKHHLVYARPRASGVLYIGSDNATLAYGAPESALLPVVAEMRGGFGVTAIIEGSYSSPSIQRFGAGRWAKLETKIEPLRRRSPLLLQLMTYATPKPETSSGEREDEDMSPEDSAAAYLLGEIAYASAMRREEGLTFWGGFFLHRIERFKRLDLPSLVSRLLTECRVEPQQAGGVTGTLSEIESSDQSAAVSAAIRARAALLAALAYDHVQRKRRNK